MTFLKWFLSPPRRAGGSSKGDWSPFEAAPPEAGKSVSAETLAAWWVWASARKWGAGLCPAQCIWQDSGFAADQTNAMLAVVRADDESLVPPQAAGLALSVARPLPTETASLGFGGSPVGGGNKNSCFAFFRHFYVGMVSLPSGRFVCVGTTPCGVYFSRKTAFSEWVLCADGHTVPS